MFSFGTVAFSHRSFSHLAVSHSNSASLFLVFRVENGEEWSLGYMCFLIKP